jgi:hypothetical protein
MRVAMRGAGLETRPHREHSRGGFAGAGRAAPPRLTPAPPQGGNAASLALLPAGVTGVRLDSISLLIECKTVSKARDFVPGRKGMRFPRASD